jgi:YesN/AraC family two-component response regulator
MNCCCNNNDFIKQYDYEQLVISRLRSLDLEGAKKAYEEFFNQYMLEKNYEESYIRNFKNYLISLTALLSHSALEDKEKICKLTSARIRLTIKIENINDDKELYLLGLSILEEYYNLLSFCCIQCKNSIINCAIDYMNQNIDKPLTLESVASSIHVSRNYLSSIFIKHTGYKFNEYINKIRINKAKELMKATEHNLLEIAYMCGFKNQNYFSTMFKKFEGVTPIGFKKGIL